jgi:hypothetical protein
MFEMTKTLTIDEFDQCVRGFVYLP